MNVEKRLFLLGILVTIHGFMAWVLKIQVSMDASPILILLLGFILLMEPKNIMQLKNRVVVRE